jgi:hypothetical protein
MLPSAPKTLGRLSDVFISALGSITGKDNRLGFAKANRSIVVLVDGLGSENLRTAAGHAPFLNARLRDSKSINTVFPSTTASAITSFGTGARPSQHGIFGYSVFDREAAAVRNMLTGWGSDADPAHYQPLDSIATKARGLGVDVFSVGPAEYADSGFTKLNMLGSSYRAAKSIGDRVLEAKKIIRESKKSLTYLYVPELDSTAHAMGVASTAWLNKLEELDAAMRELASELPADTGLILTADHGIVDVPSENQVMLDEISIPGLLAVSGDPRNTFIYLDDAVEVNAVAVELTKELKGRVIVATTAEVIAKGWFGGQPSSNIRLLPDLFLISTSNFACYHRGWCKPQSLRMIGQHGGISASELSVPLLKFGCY